MLLYTAFGETRYASGSTSTSYHYTGQREEAGLGLYFYNARWYDPALGRFIQPDSMVPNPGNPMDWDRYAYVRNNPVNNTDPTGHKECDYKCQVEYQNADPAKEYYGGGVEPDYAAQKKNQEIAETILFDGTELAASILSEPVDWALTAYHCIEGDCSPFALLGLLPLIPSSAANKIDDVVDAVKKFDKNQDALIQLAKEAKKIGGVTEEEVKILKEWADEYEVLFRGPESHPNRNFSQFHIHLGPIDHIIIKEGNQDAKQAQVL